MRSRSLLVVLVLALLGTASFGRTAHAANGVPDCEDGIDNDGDGLVDYPADPGCTAIDGPSENPAATPDLGVGDLSTDDGFPPGEAVRDGDTTFEPADGGSQGPTGGINPSGDGQDPVRQSGCSIGDEQTPTVPVLLVLLIGGGIALLARRTRT